MSKGFTLAAKFHAEMIRCHVVSAPAGRTVSARREKHISALYSNLKNYE
jgi:hypothetical protein